MSNVPKVRSRLPEIADELQALARTLTTRARELRKLEKELYRETGPRVTPRSQKITAELRSAVVAMKLANPNMSHQEIGGHFNINPGRVSEILRGLR